MGREVGKGRRRLWIEGGWRGGEGREEGEGGWRI